MQNIRAVLLDRDGTIIKDKHYLADPGGVELLPGVADVLCGFAKQGMRFFLVSNQSGIGRGYFPLEAAVSVNRRVAELLAPYGIQFTDMIFCPHAPEEGCDCRKPGLGMWLTLRERFDLVPGECLMVGDKEEDMLFASAAGLALRALVYTGKGAETAKRLGIELPGKNYLQLTAEPQSPSYPHLAVPSFTLLRLAMRLIAMRRDA